MKKLKILLSGAGGYGKWYLDALLSSKRDDFELAGAVDPVENAGLAQAREAGIPVYSTIADFLKEHTADLAILACPIRFHEEQAIQCMQAGMDVLCEKPIAATPEAGERMMAARSGRRLTVGFQWCHDRAMQAMKADIGGRLGKPVCLKSLILWPRDLAYYARGGGWAGKKYGPGGEPIFDSVASNATAHYLMNMLWLCEEDLTIDLAECRRANAIETFDTVYLEGRAGDCRIVYAASHAVDQSLGPVLDYRFERGRVRWCGGELIARMEDGSQISYGVSDPDCVQKMYKLWDLVDSLLGKSDAPDPCPPEAAMRHARAMSDLRALCPEAEVFPEEITRRDGRAVWVEGLFGQLKERWEKA